MIKRKKPQELLPGASVRIRSLADHVNRDYLSNSLTATGFSNDFRSIGSWRYSSVCLVAESPRNRVLTGLIGSASAGDIDFLTIAGEDSHRSCRCAGERVTDGDWSVSVARGPACLADNHVTDDGSADCTFFHSYLELTGASLVGGERVSRGSSQVTSGSRGEVCNVESQVVWHGR